MKIRIDLVDDLTEDEVLIRCGRVDDKILKIQQFISEQGAQPAPAASAPAASAPAASAPTAPAPAASAPAAPAPAASRSAQSQPAEMTFYKDNQEFYFPIGNVLFFETDGDRIYAHTASEVFRIKYRLYELDAVLPKQFVRASKSAVINVTHVYSVSRNITASSLVEFKNSHKHVYVSRHYYKEVRQRLNERSNYEK